MAGKHRRPMQAALSVGYMNDLHQPKVTKGGFRGYGVKEMNRRCAIVVAREKAAKEAACGSPSPQAPPA